MGASCWKIVVPWKAELDRALEDAHVLAWVNVPERHREIAASLPVEQILAMLDLDLDDDPAALEQWSTWLADAPPWTRYAASRGLNGTGSILDIDHVVEPPRPRTPATAGGAGGFTFRLATPTPGLGSVRWATPDELTCCYETERPTEVDDGERWWSSLERGQAIAVVRWADDRPHDIVFFGVTGD